MGCDGCQRIGFTVKGTASELEDFYDPEFDGHKIITSYDKSRFDSDEQGLSGYRP